MTHPVQTAETKDTNQADSAETQLIRDCLANKRGAHELFYKRFYGYVMSIALRYSNHSEEAKEITNDSFVKVFKHLNRYDQHRPIKSWMRRIVINTALDRLRKNKRELRQTDIEQIVIPAPEESVLQQLSAEDIMRMVQHLSAAQRAVFNLFEIEGFSHEEIGEMLDIPVGTSKSHLARAKMKLRQMISERQYGKEF
ncbi:MAG: RNA polymerase sigma factor [Cytophagales bacterium]|nr:RNA polymerase sigma factor [Bernardetiaceae bacterium]MDW8204289.1 RNA polymerase sigma factor [Cytophagales bacterium]